MNVKYLSKKKFGGSWDMKIKYSFEIICKDNEDINFFHKELKLDWKYQFGDDF